MTFPSLPPLGRIIHNSADVLFLKRYQSLRHPNVKATRVLAQMAAVRNINFHFVSTDDVVNVIGQGGLAEFSVPSLGLKLQAPVDGSHEYVVSR